eukprot:9284650-Lingulodinium_polyedra.AAC.1
MHERVHPPAGGAKVDWHAPDVPAVRDGEGTLRCPPVAKGAINIYVGGFVCKDNSSANRHKKVQP